MLYSYIANIPFTFLLFLGFWSTSALTSVKFTYMQNEVVMHRTIDRYYSVFKALSMYIMMCAVVHCLTGC